MRGRGKGARRGWGAARPRGQRSTRDGDGVAQPTPADACSMTLKDFLDKQGHVASVHGGGYGRKARRSSYRGEIDSCSDDKSGPDSPHIDPERPAPPKRRCTERTFRETELAWQLRGDMVHLQEEPFAAAGVWVPGSRAALAVRRLKEALQANLAGASAQPPDVCFPQTELCSMGAAGTSRRYGSWSDRMRAMDFTIMGWKSCVEDTVSKLRDAIDRPPGCRMQRRNAAQARGQRLARSLRRISARAAEYRGGVPARALRVFDLVNSRRAAAQHPAALCSELLRGGVGGWLLPEGPVLPGVKHVFVDLALSDSSQGPVQQSAGAAVAVTGTHFFVDQREDDCNVRAALATILQSLPAVQAVAFVAGDEKSNTLLSGVDKVQCCGIQPQFCLPQMAPGRRCANLQRWRDGRGPVMCIHAQSLEGGRYEFCRDLGGSGRYYAGGPGGRYYAGGGGGDRPGEESKQREFAQRLCFGSRVQLAHTVVHLAYPWLRCGLRGVVVAQGTERTDPDEWGVPATLLQVAFPEGVVGVTMDMMVEADGGNLLSFAGQVLDDAFQLLADAGIGSQSRVEVCGTPDGRLHVPPAGEGTLLVFVRVVGSDTELALEVDAEATVGGLAMLAARCLAEAGDFQFGMEVIHQALGPRYPCIVLGKGVSGGYDLAVQGHGIMRAAPASLLRTLTTDEAVTNQQFRDAAALKASKDAPDWLPPGPVLPSSRTLRVRQLIRDIGRRPDFRTSQNRLLFTGNHTARWAASRPLPYAGLVVNLDTTDLESHILRSACCGRQVDGRHTRGVVVTIIRNCPRKREYDLERLQVLAAAGLQGEVMSVDQAAEYVARHVEVVDVPGDCALRTLPGYTAAPAVERSAGRSPQPPPKRRQLSRRRRNYRGGRRGRYGVFPAGDQGEAAERASCPDVELDFDEIAAEAAEMPPPPAAGELPTAGLRTLPVRAPRKRPPAASWEEAGRRTLRRRLSAFGTLLPGYDSLSAQVNAAAVEAGGMHVGRPSVVRHTDPMKVDASELAPTGRPLLPQLILPVQLLTEWHLRSTPRMTADTFTARDPAARYAGLRYPLTVFVLRAFPPLDRSSSGAAPLSTSSRLCRVRWTVMPALDEPAAARVAGDIRRSWVTVDEHVTTNVEGCAPGAMSGPGIGRLVVSGSCGELILALAHARSRQGTGTPLYSCAAAAFSPHWVTEYVTRMADASDLLLPGGVTPAAARAAAAPTGGGGPVMWRFRRKGARTTVEQVTGEFTCVDRYTPGHHPHLADHDVVSEQGALVEPKLAAVTCAFLVPGSRVMLEAAALSGALSPLYQFCDRRSAFALAHASRRLQVAAHCVQLYDPRFRLPAPSPKRDHRCAQGVAVLALYQYGQWTFREPLLYAKGKYVLWGGELCMLPSVWNCGSELERPRVIIGQLAGGDSARWAADAAGAAAAGSARRSRGTGMGPARGKGRGGAARRCRDEVKAPTRTELEVPDGARVNLRCRGSRGMWALRESITPGHCCAAKGNVVSGELLCCFVGANSLRDGQDDSHGEGGSRSCDGAGSD
eukprot:TRINITY_DN12411_c0_g1_i1.p1 TRINITY_DN12411_c0_g1~~TRINITY_DN12411_c0_g1_i1.p1  ORF type:complete len:1561 (+),score=197.01 TRINITY_DN12411_c0_g1_i1:81-4685(+)